MKNKKTDQNLKKFQELMNKILQSASYELDSYIDGDTFAAESLEVSDKILNDFFQLLPDIILEKGEEYFSGLLEKNSEYENCKKFFAWLYEYVQTINRVYQKTASIRELDIDEFRKLLNFCVENLILHNIGIEEAGNTEQGDELYNKGNLKLMGSLLNTYFMNVFKGNSKYAIAHSMRRSLGLSEDRCQLFWEGYLQNEDALWKKYSMKLQKEINDKLDIFIETFIEMDEE